jgi:signal transduction histidine kinase
MDPIHAGSTPVHESDRRARGRRFARVGRVLPVALVQIAGTLLASRISGPLGGSGGPPWFRHGVGGPAVDAAQPGALALALLVAGVLVLPWRWRWPRSVLVVTLVTTAGYALLVTPRGPFVAALTMAVVNAWLRDRRTTAVVVAAVAVAVLPTADVITGRAGGVGADAVLVAVAWAAVTLSVAELVRVRLDRAAERRRRRVEAEQQRARDERVRIARELHDSVAHGMSLISLQAGVALHLGAELPEQTRRSLTDIRDTSRDALVELRTILGVLRSVDGADGSTADSARDGTAGRATDGAVDRNADDTVADGAADAGRPARAPTAGLDRLPDLVDRARAAGLEIRTDLDGDPAGLDGTTDRNAFRIVQESVTNVMKHAPDHATTITVHVGRDVVELRVEDRPVPGPTAAARPAPAGSSVLLGVTGNGLIGMRERATAVGGSFSAGPTPSGGWRVTAQLPAGTTTRSRTETESSP